VGLPLRGAVADGNDTAKGLSRLHPKGGGDLFVGHGHPAGVETQLLGRQHDFSPLIAAQFLNPGTLSPDQGHMVFMKKFSIVSHGAVKGPGSFQNRLDVKAAFSVAPVDAVQQGLEGFPLDGAVCVGADRVAGVNGV